MDIDFMEIDGNYFKKIMFFFLNLLLLFFYMVIIKLFFIYVFFFYKYRFFEIVSILYRYIYII